MAPSSRRAAGVGPPSGKSGRRAPGRRAGRGTSGGARRIPGPTRKRARAHQANADLAASGAAPPYPGFIPGGSDDLRWATSKKPGSRGGWRELDIVAEISEVSDQL